MKPKPSAQACPCGGASYAACCAPFIEHHAIAPSAAELMRSRYTAYTLRDSAYVQATWHASTRPAAPPEDEPNLKWLGLDVRRHATDGDTATVEFVARYKIDGRAYRLHEISRFVREDGRWFYVDGSFPEGEN